MADREPRIAVHRRLSDAESGYREGAGERLVVEVAALPALAMPRDLGRPWESRIGISCLALGTLGMAAGTWVALRESLALAVIMGVVTVIVAAITALMWSIYAGWPSPPVPRTRLRVTEDTIEREVEDEGWRPVVPTERVVDVHVASRRIFNGVGARLDDGTWVPLLARTATAADADYVVRELSRFLRERG